MGGSSSRVSPVGVSQQAPTRLAEADGNVELVVEPVAEPAETGVGGHGAAPPAAPAFDEVSEEEAALWETLLHSPAALAASAGISAERLHELFVRASAEVAKNRADAASTAGSRYRVGALREAAAAGDLDKVVSCLAAGVSPNCQNSLQSGGLCSMRRDTATSLSCRRSSMPARIRFTSTNRHVAKITQKARPH